MAESNATQVILTDDGLKIIKAQDTANEAVGNVNDINSDNKLTPSEKIKLKQEYDKDLKIYTIDTSQLQSAGLPTAELDSAMSNLTNFVTPLFKEMNITSTIDRDALNSVFTAFATADKNASQAFVNMVQQVADDAKKAGDDAKEAGEKAQEAGEEAKASADQAKADATQAKADAATAQQKAQSSIDQFNAHLPDIDEALSTANLVKQNVTKLSDTTEQYHNEYTTGIQDVVKTIDDITIGGTNLIKNSSSDVVIDDTVNNQGWAYHPFYTALEAGQEYTFTSSVTVNAGKADNICINVFNPNNGATTLVSNRPVVNGKIEYTFTAVKDFPQLLACAGTLGGTQGNKVTFHHYQLEKGNKATDWSPAPEDLATSTEFDQLNNAIKLKADSTDVTSQITVATTGIQNTVNNKADKSQVTQLADQYQAVVGSMAGSSLVPNSGYPIDTKHWAIGGTKGNFNAVTHGFYHNSKDNVFMLRNQGAQPTLECYVSSERFPVKPNTQYSLSFKGFASGNVPSMDVYFLGRKYSSTSTIGYDNPILIVDKKVLSPSHVDTVQAVFNTGDCEEGYLRFDNNGSTDGKDSGLFFTEVQVNAGTIAMPWSAPTLSQADITASIGNIHLGVKNADGSTSTFNMNGNTILMDTAQTIINGNTSIQDGTIGTAKIANAAINTAQIADGAINNAKIANASIDDAKINSLNGNKLVENSITANKIDVNDLIANGINAKTLTAVNLNASTINGSTINGTTINTPNLNLGDNGQITGAYSVHDDIGWFQPIDGTGSLKIANGYIRSSANIIYYNKILNGVGGGKWGHWASSTQFVPAPDQAHPDIGNVAESSLTPAFLKLDILSDDKSKVNSRVYIDGTGLYINDGNGSRAISAMLSDYELVSSGMAYLNSGIQMKQEATFTFGNLSMTGYHTFSMLDGKALYFTDGQHPGNPIELVAKTFTKSSRLSIKHDITPLSTAESSRLLNAIDVEKFRYTNDNATYKYQYGGVIDDVNSPDNKQYSMPHELLNEEGTGINLDSLTGILVKRVQDQDKTIGELSMRLTKLEMEK